MLPAPLVKALVYILSVLVSMVPAVGPEGILGGGSSGSGGDGLADDAGRLTTVVGEVLVNATPDEDENVTAAPEPAPTPPPQEEAPPANGSGELPPPPPAKPYVKPQPPAAPFSARFTETSLTLPAGAAAPLTLVVTNEHDWHLTITVVVAEVTPGWHANVRTERLEIEPGESREVAGYLEAPEDAEPGAEGRVRVDLSTPFPATTLSAVASGRVPEPQAHRDVSIYNPDGNRYVAPGSTANYSLTVTNLGNVEDVYRLSIAPGPAAWSSSLSSYSVRLLPGEMTSVVLVVTAPGDAPDESAAFFNVTAESQSDPSAASRTSTITVVDAENAGALVDLEVVCVTLPPEATGRSETDPVERACIDLRPYLALVPEESDEPQP